MTTCRFRMKYEYDPTSLWRDIVAGENRSLVEVQRQLNVSVGLDRDHRWFFGTDQDYWNSDVTYEGRPPFDPSPGPPMGGGNTYDAAETTIAQMARQLHLDERDRICHLFDYGDEWRFYGILTEIDEDRPADGQPTVVNSKGDPVDPYPTPDEEW